MPEHERLDPYPNSAIPHVGTYQRVVPVNLQRMYENALDWEHLPFVHQSSFSSIECLDAGDWGWRALVRNTQGAESELELRLDRSCRRWITRNLAGPSAGAEIWTHVFEIDGNSLQLIIDFFVPGVPEDARIKVGAAYARTYTTLYDEDVAMMVDRQVQLNRRMQSNYAEKAIDLGLVDEALLPKHFELAGKQYVLNKVAQQWTVYPAQCPHLLGPLAEGELVQSNSRILVTCPWHGYQFDVKSGDCVTGQSWRLSRQPTIVEVNGEVTVSID